MSCILEVQGWDGTGGIDSFRGLGMMELGRRYLGVSISNGSLTCSFTNFPCCSIRNRMRTRSFPIRRRRGTGWEVESLHTTVCRQARGQADVDVASFHCTSFLPEADMLRSCPGQAQNCVTSTAKARNLSPSTKAETGRKLHPSGTSCTPDGNYCMLPRFPCRPPGRCVLRLAQSRRW